MIVFLATRGHEFGVKHLVGQTFPGLPECRSMCYEEFFLATTLPVATFVFTDIDRLAPWETRIAAQRYRALTAAGMRCLNDPARVMCRRELLRTLFRRKFNPFNVYPADFRPRPKRFPVFVRSEAEHRRILEELLPDQPSLDRKLDELRNAGTALRDLLVVEFAAEPVAPGGWRRAGTFRIGDAVLVECYINQNHWRVSDGTKGLATEAMFQEESEAVRSGVRAEAVRPAFEVAGIEWGRADHAIVDGREVVYEINTNPTIGGITGQLSPIREQTLAHSRVLMASALREIDNAGSGTFELGLPSEIKRLEVVEARAIARP